MPETPLESLFPRSKRKERVRQIFTDIGVQREPEWTRPKWLTSLIPGVAGAGGIVIAAYLALHPFSSKSALMDFAFASPIVAAILFGASFVSIATLATGWMRMEFRPDLITVAHLSRWIVANAPDAVKAPPGKWSREQVSEVIRDVVIDVLGCENRYREDAQFIRDLGMD